MILKEYSYMHFRDGDVKRCYFIERLGMILTMRKRVYYRGNKLTVRGVVTEEVEFPVQSSGSMRNEKEKEREQERERTRKRERDGGGENVKTKTDTSPSIKHYI